MSGFINAEIPFVMVGNRQALTGLQLAEEPWLRDFVKRFEHCFEPATNLDCLFYNPPEGA